MNIINILTNRNKVLGMNQRNLFYIHKYNKHKSKLIADDKLLTKKYLKKLNIPNPDLLAVINDSSELMAFDWESLPKSFVIKPVSGLEGGGIDIFYNRNKDGQWIRADKSRVSKEQLIKICQEILSGRYSLHQEPDRIMFESRVKMHHRFKYYSFKGAPDIRIIVFNGIPVMSYVRLPTKESNGRANLALGALGVGIDMASGTTTTGIHGKSGKIEYVPGTNLRVSGLKIPYWEKILHYAVEAQKATGLNFAAVDFLIDRENGPMIVELNARPGLSIQLANADGLLWRLKKIQGIKVKSVDHGIRLAKDLFGGEIEESIESLSGKDVIGLYENVTLYTKDMRPLLAKAKIDTGADSTSIDKELAKQIGFEAAVKILESMPDDITDRSRGLELVRQYNQTLITEENQIIEFTLVKSSHGYSIRPYIKVNLKLQDTIFETKCSIYDRSNLSYPIIIGRKSLAKFLVDPSKISISQLTKKK